jgi:O-methyltransferase
MRSRSPRALLRAVRHGRDTEAAPVSPLADLEELRTSPEDRRIIEQALPYTMTGARRLQALVDAVRYCEQRGVAGAFVECGVWRGGSVLAMVLTLQELGADDRDLYLFDTFEGMTEPSAQDVSAFEPPAWETWRRGHEDGDDDWAWMFAEGMFEEGAVRRLLVETGYPPDRIHLVRGPVEETIPEHQPEAIALLRLDTDWYESTRHELEHLYPVLASAGVLIVDDYGHWEGARQATDEYFATSAPPPMLSRIDYAARIAVKA